MNKYRAYFIRMLSLAILIVFSGPLLATNDGGGDAWTFLKLGIGARANGMGGAFVAIADDATAAYWNPAGLGLLEKREATFMRIAPTSRYDDPTASGIAGDHNYISICYPTSIGNPCISANYFTIDGIKQTTGSSEADFAFFEPDGKDSEMALIGSYGVNLASTFPRWGNWNWVLLVGANAKYMRQKFFDVSTDGWGWDVGFLIKKKNGDNSFLRSLRMGYIFRYNFARGWKGAINGEAIDENYADLATSDWQVGLAFDPIGNLPLTTAFSLVNPNKGSPLELAIGSELKIIGIVALRAGINSLPIQKRKHSDTIWEEIKYKGKYTFGAGLILSPVQLDYAISFEPLAIKHLVSLAFRI